MIAVSAITDKMEELTRKLMRIGLDNIYGFISDVELPGIELQTADLIAVDELKQYVGKDDVQIVDVRGVNEYKLRHIPGADNVFVGTIEDFTVYTRDAELAAIAQPTPPKHQRFGFLVLWKARGKPGLTTWNLSPMTANK